MARLALAAPPGGLGRRPAAVQEVGGSDGEQAKDDGDLSLFRLDPGGNTATRVPVRIGVASVDRVEILRGLKAGDQLILSDTSQWDKYDRIKLK